MCCEAGTGLSASMTGKPGKIPYGPSFMMWEWERSGGAKGIRREKSIKRMGGLDFECRIGFPVNVGAFYDGSFI